MGIADSNLSFGFMKKGKRNLITDVPGVKVGHLTLASGDIQTGVTAIIPGEGSCFDEKFIAAAHVINGFGKSVGLMQVQELGTLETPILLTNTFSVPIGVETMFRIMMAENEEIGGKAGTVNPVVLECNDGVLNDIRGMHIKEEHFREAMDSAKDDFEEGAVGAGRGMKSFGWKSGIGSASRIIEVDGKEYCLGVLLLSNFGGRRDLTICGKSIPPVDEFTGKGNEKDNPESDKDKGSCAIVLATNLPMTSNQLLRAAKRVQNGLALTGSITGNGSGDIVLAFSTANRIPREGENKLLKIEAIHESLMDKVFRAVKEATEESVISSLFHSETTTGRGGKTAYGIKDFNIEIV